MRLTEVVVITIAVRPTTTVGAGEEAKVRWGGGGGGGGGLKYKNTPIYLPLRLFAHKDSCCEEEV